MQRDTGCANYRATTLFSNKQCISFKRQRLSSEMQGVPNIGQQIDLALNSVRHLKSYNYAARYRECQL